VDVVNARQSLVVIRPDVPDIDVFPSGEEVRVSVRTLKPADGRLLRPSRH
jgi:hypothetical protein